jgi:hypothetical protein
MEMVNSRKELASLTVIGAKAKVDKLDMQWQENGMSINMD